MMSDNLTLGQLAQWVMPGQSAGLRARPLTFHDRSFHDVGPLALSTATGGNSDPGKRQYFGP